MKEENNGASKNKLSRVFRKKWFFPAMYLTVAAVLLTIVVWYQNLDNLIPDALDDLDQSENFVPVLDDGEVEAVLDQQEVIKMPVEDVDQAEIVTKFYDHNADQEDKENALILYNNRYYQSTGIDIASAEGKEFDVVASLSGTVLEVKESPLLGKIIVLSHENDVETHYASLGEIKVKAGAKVKQGDVLATAGRNLYGKDNGTHVYFELQKENQKVNPEAYFNQPVSKLDTYTSENDDVETGEDNEDNEDNEDDEENEENDESNLNEKD